MTCSICNHPKRADIEKACLLRDFGDTQVTLRDIATEFNVDLKDLQVHVLMHMPLELELTKDNSESESIAGKIKRREADVLRAIIEDSYVTFKNLSQKINSVVSCHTADASTLTQITKPVVDLYLGTSQTIRENVSLLLKIDMHVNGEEDKGLQTLASLVNAIRGSGPND